MHTDTVAKSKGRKIHDWAFAAAAFAATVFAGFMLGRTLVDSTSSRNPWVLLLVMVIMAGVALVALHQARTTHEPIEEDDA